MVGLQLHLDVKKGKRSEFLQMCEMISKATDIPKGRMGQELFEEVGEPTRFLWSERWRDFGSLDAYLASEGYRVLLGAIDVLGNLREREVFQISDEG